jgi:hypothetical protein
MSWTTSAVLRHGFRSCTSDPWRVASVAFFVGASCFVAVHAEVTEGAHARGDYEQRINDGGAILIVSGDHISAAACESMRDQHGVLAAGGLRDLPVSRWGADGQTPIPVGEVTPGFVSLIHATGRAGVRGWVLGDYVASALGLRSGDPFSLEGGSADQVASVVPGGPRSDLIAGWALRPVPPVGTVLHCWVEASSIETTAVEASVIAALSTGESLQVRPLLADRSLTVESWRRLFRHAGDQYAYLGAALVIATGLLLGRVRRTEFVLVRSLGMTRSQLCIASAIEAWIAVIPAVVWGCGAALVTSTAQSSYRDKPYLAGTVPHALAAAALIGLAALVVVPLASLAGRENVIESLKDR